jgi:predicted SAM-dependent methyltransferase
MKCSPSGPSSVESVLNSYLEHRTSDVIGALDVPRRIVHTIVPPANRLRLRRLLTKSMTLQARSRASRLATRTPLRLNLGSSTSHLAGWVNVDLVGDGADLTWDLSRPLPFVDGSVESIFHEHVLEHFELTAAFGLLRDSHRLLTSGGILRIGVPDAGAYLQAYTDPDNDFLQEARPSRPTRMLAVQELFYNHGHRSAYDYETLALLLSAIGFRSVERRSFGESSLEPCPDGEHRRVETLYVEARR